MKSALDLRRQWLEDQDSDNYFHVLSSIDTNTAPGLGVGGLKSFVSFEHKNKPFKEWKNIMLTHLSELGYVVTEDQGNWNIEF